MREKNSENDIDAGTEFGNGKIKFRDMESLLRSEGVSACLKLGHAGHVQSHENLEGDDMKMNKEHDSTLKRPTCLGLDLNAADNSNLVEHNPFSPYKKMGQVNIDPIECGSTTGSMEESADLKLWKEMKQNGFLSSSNGGIPRPKKHSRLPKKRKKDLLKKKIVLAKREQVNRFNNIVAPSGLLSGLNPGIINHVRNRKQVISIIKSVVESEKMDGKNDNQHGSKSKDINDGKTDQESIRGSADCHLRPCSHRTSTFSSCECKSKVSELRGIPEDRVCHESSVASQFTSECEDDTLELKLLSAATVASENASCISNDEFSVTQESITSLSMKGATVASQWLELLHQDIKGRLSALRSSRKRVQNAIRTELPYLLSTELSYNQVNSPFAQSSHATAVSDLHVARWKSIFNQMDKALSDEGKHLEGCLEQVKEMRINCDKGLKSAGLDGLALFGSSNDSRLKSTEALEGENAIRAAAASIYSTCDLIMKGDSMEEHEHISHVRPNERTDLTRVI